MILRRVSLFILLSFSLVLSACKDPDEGPINSPEGTVFGYAPVYGSVSLANSEIVFLAPRDIKNPGKIYRYENYLLVNEMSAGIHVFDNTDPAVPQPIGFIQMMGNTDMSVKGNILYADHMGQLVALSITDFSSFEEKGRVELGNWSGGIPAPPGYYFECMDKSKGIVVGWRPTKLQKPKCYAF